MWSTLLYVHSCEVGRCVEDSCEVVRCVEDSWEVERCVEDRCVEGSCEHSSEPWSSEDIGALK